MIINDAVVSRFWLLHFYMYARIYLFPLPISLSLFFLNLFCWDMRNVNESCVHELLFIYSEEIKSAIFALVFQQHTDFLNYFNWHLYNLRSMRIRNASSYHNKKKSCNTKNKTLKFMTKICDSNSHGPSIERVSKNDAA